MVGLPVVCWIAPGARFAGLPGLLDLDVCWFARGLPVSGVQ